MIILVLVLLLTMTACGTQTATVRESTEPTQTPEATVVQTEEPVQIEEETEDMTTEVQPTEVGVFDLENGVVLLNSGYEMPILGIGCYLLSNEQAENSVYWALRDGYRLIDTARIYGNEVGVGRGIQRAIDEGFVTW